MRLLYFLAGLVAGVLLYACAQSGSAQGAGIVTLYGLDYGAGARNATSSRSEAEWNYWTSRSATISGSATLVQLSCSETTITPLTDS